MALCSHSIEKIEKVYENINELFDNIYKLCCNLVTEINYVH